MQNSSADGHSIDLARIEKLESEVYRLNQRLSLPSTTFTLERGQTSPSTTHTTEINVNNAYPAAPRLSPTSGPARQGATVTTSVDSSSALNDYHGTLIGFSLREASIVDVVSSSAVPDGDARLFFSTFLEGCVWFVSIFDLSRDSYDSIRSRSSILFDTLIIIGARATHGVLSKDYQLLHHLLRQHTSDLVLRLSAEHPSTTMEDIQALLVIAAYSDSGAVLCDVAVRASIRIGLDRRVEKHLMTLTSVSHYTSAQLEAERYPVRVWYYLFVLDMILSIDGGKPPSLMIQPCAARRVRVFVSSARCNAPDVRLFAQVELNAIRSAAHEAIAGPGKSYTQQEVVERTLRGAVLDLDLWLSEWQMLVASLHFSAPEQTSVLLNLRIQHAWATLVLHLRGLTAYGIENIALMTTGQRSVAAAAKTSAERHLQLVLTKTTFPAENASHIPYVASFRYAMDFVWAKNAFCVLIALRLGILLGDPVTELLSRLLEAREFLTELNRVNVGAHMSYMRILSQIVEKCERAIAASMPNENGTYIDPSENDFQSFVPKEFMFEWDFPGIHLHYISLDWQDLLFDIGTGT